MIAAGNSNVGDIMLGEKPVLKVYAGEDLVYSRNALPYDAEVEYLQSSNQKYINTRIECNSSYTIEVEMQTDALNTECIIGARLGTNNKEHAMVLTSENKIRYKCSTSSNAVVYTPTDPSAWMHLKGQYNKFIVDGTEVGTLTASTFALTGVPYYLFAMNTNNTASNLGAKRIRMCKIWNGDTLLLDLIPVVKNSVGYMYDRVSGELLGNAGSGNFIIGPQKQ